MQGEKIISRKGLKRRWIIWLSVIIAGAIFFLYTAPILNSVEFFFDRPKFDMRQQFKRDPLVGKSMFEIVDTYGPGREHHSVLPMGDWSDLMFGEFYPLRETQLDIFFDVSAQEPHEPFLCCFKNLKPTLKDTNFVCIGVVRGNRASYYHDIKHHH